MVLGLCGGVAAGKSTVAQAFGDHGLMVLDADQIARQVTAEPAVVAAIAADLGPACRRADGTLDREQVAARVFSDPAARARLEALTHPPVRAAILDRLHAALAQGRSVLLDVPLLLERGLVDECDHVVFVRASEAVRQQRAAARGWGLDELARRERAQTPLAEKEARADFAIDNDEGLLRMREQVAALLRRLEPGTNAAP